VFVGRKAELDQFDTILQNPAPHAVLVVGPPGMGKTLLVERMMSAAEIHPDLKCGAVRYEVTPTDTVDSILELMLDHAYDAAAQTEGSLAPTDRRRKQMGALFKAVVPKGDKLVELARSLKRDPAKNARDQFMHRITLVAESLPENGRAVFVIDPEECMAADSDQAWAIVARGLPPKVKLVFAQRPDDVLVTSQPFNALDSLVRIPDHTLEAFDQRAVDDLITVRAPDVGLGEDVLREAVARYQGHPYAVDAALNLLEAGTPVDALPPDPDGIAQAQWDKACDLDEKAIPLLEAYAVLEVAVPDDVVEPVSGLNAATRKHLLANPFFKGLLRDEADGRRIYHALLADCIKRQISDAGDYHERAITTYRERLNAKAKPDALAAQRLPEHVLVCDGGEAFVLCFINECSKPLMNLGFLDAFIAHTGRALTMVEKDSMDEASLLGNLGLIYRTRGDLNRAEEKHTKSLEIETQLDRREGMAHQYGNLGLIHSIRGDLDRAEEMFRKALDIHEQLGNREGMAADYGNLGLIYRTRGDLDRAEEMHRKALEIAQQLGHREGMANQYGNLGLIYHTRGDLDRAEEMLRKSLEIAGQLGRREGMAAAYGNLGMVYRTRGDLERAEEMLRKALDINDQLGRLEGMANQYANLGNVFLNRGDLDRAEEMHRKALEINEQLGRREGVAIQYGNLGLIHRDRGDLDRAEEMLRKALDIHEQLGRREGMAADYGNLGGLCKDRGDAADARRYWTQARDLYREIGVNHMARQIQDWLDGLPKEE